MPVGLAGGSKERGALAAGLNHRSTTQPEQYDGLAAATTIVLLWMKCAPCEFTK